MLRLPYIQTHTREVSKTLVFPLFDSFITNRWTDGRTKPLLEMRVHNYKFWGLFLTHYFLIQSGTLTQCDPNDEKNWLLSRKMGPFCIPHQVVFPFLPPCRGLSVHFLPFLFLSYSLFLVLLAFSLFGAHVWQHKKLIHVDTGMILTPCLKRNPLCKSCLFSNLFKDEIVGRRFFFKEKWWE